VYRWVDGTRLSNYSHSWRAWSQHTATPEFAQQFSVVLTTHAASVDDMAFAVEQFLLNEAIKCNVVIKQHIKAAANPNR
jgi:hypothetical protein